jgi:hypothetical protein
MMNRQVPASFAAWAVVLLAFSMAAALGGGLYEQIVLVPLWSASPPASFATIQPGTGVPLQNFWVPVHGAITLFFVLSLVFNWRRSGARRLLLISLCSYVVMRAWSFWYFIPEMLAFQQVPLDSPPSVELARRVASWTFWTSFREPLDLLSFGCCLLALYWIGTSERRSDSPTRPELASAPS